jgi:REP element-mobilizing transposase RayT
MGQSLNKIYVHLVFSTKHRNPLITNSIKEELFSYIGGICKNLECNPIQVGGEKDHVHILCLLSKKIALMDLIEKIKSNSSKWIKTKGSELKISIGKVVMVLFLLILRNRHRDKLY